MASGACAPTGEAMANAPPTSQSQEIFLGEEEISDVSLATFYVFDKESTGPLPLRLARGCGGGGCGGHGCGGCHGCGGGGCHMGCGGCRCGGCHVACHGCGHGHFFFRGCGGCGGCGGCSGCGGTCWIWTPAWGWVYSCSAESLPSADASPIASEGKIEKTADPAGTVDGSVGGTRTK